MTKPTEEAMKIAVEMINLTKSKVAIKAKSSDCSGCCGKCGGK